MGKATTGIGLDIGNSSIKIVELEAHKNIQVNRFGIYPLPNSVLNAGIITDIAQVSRAIKELVQTTKIKYKKAIVAIAGQAVIVRHIKMPYMTREEIANAIRWEAERYIPFSIDEVNLDFQIVEEDKNQNEMEVMLVCAHNDIIYSHLHALDDAGVKPLAMDIQPFALMRAMGMEETGAAGSYALLDIGAGTTDLTIVKNGVPRFTRIIPVAGMNMTDNIRSHLNIDFKEAEKAKITHGDALFDFDKAADEYIMNVNYSLQTSLKELVLELRRSFDYYRLQQRNEEIKELLISGGGSKLRNLLPYLRQQLELPVQSSFNKGIVECSGKLKAEFEDAYSILTVALGLALREVAAG